MLIYLLIAFGGLRLMRRGQSSVLALLVAPTLATYLALAAARLHVVPRFASFLALPMLALVGFGLAEVVAVMRRGRLSRLVLATAVVGAVGFAARFVVVADSALRRPIENYAGVAAVVDRAPGAVVVNAGLVPPLGLRHYVSRPIGVLPPQLLADRVCRGPGPLVVVIDHLLASPVDSSCLQRRGVQRLTISQGIDPGWIGALATTSAIPPSIDVWLVPSSSAAPEPSARR